MTENRKFKQYVREYANLRKLSYKQAWQALMKQPYSPIEDLLSKKEAVIFRSQVLTYDLSLAIIFGDTGSGKTTFQKMLTQSVTEDRLRAVCIHQKDNEIYKTEKSKIYDISEILGEKEINYLVRRARGMRPDIITVDNGSIPENLLFAVCQGHMGGVTLNASTYEEALAQFEEQKHIFMPEEVMEPVVFFQTVRQGNTFSVNMIN